jgi:RNase H-like domain found in reverse transcriptase
VPLLQIGVELPGPYDRPRDPIGIREEHTSAAHGEVADYPDRDEVILGLCNIYRRFARGFAKIAAPLNALLRKGESPQLGELTDIRRSSFKTLRDCLLNPAILALPKSKGQFTLDTDASSDQICFCLSPEHQDGEKHPLRFCSRG